MGSAGQPHAAAPSESAAAEWRRFFSFREIGVYYPLLILVVVLAVVTTYMGKGNYLSVNNLTNVIYQASLTSIIAIAMTVILISGNFDLSVASVGALAGAIVVTYAEGLGFVPAAMLGMLAAIAVGLINGSIVQFVGVNAFVVTLGTMTAIRGLVLVFMGGNSVYIQADDVIEAMKTFEAGLIPVGYPVATVGLLFIGIAIYGYVKRRQVHRGLAPSSLVALAGGLFLLGITWGNGFDVKLAKPAIFMMIFMVLVWFVMGYTTVGRRMYAVGGNPEAARLAGVNVTLYKLSAFVLCSATAGFAGILFASRLKSMNPTGLQGSELTVIAAAILGGTSLFGGKGSVVKTVAGALLLFTLTNGFNITNLGGNYQGLVEGLVVITAATIYTIGGSRRGKKSS